MRAYWKRVAGQLDGSDRHSAQPTKLDLRHRQLLSLVDTAKTGP
jgi:hypothetical protein